MGVTGFSVDGGVVPSASGFRLKAGMTEVMKKFGFTGTRFAAGRLRLWAEGWAYFQSMPREWWRDHGQT